MTASTSRTLWCMIVAAALAPACHTQGTAPAPAPAPVSLASFAPRVSSLVAPYVQGEWLHGVSVALVTPNDQWFYNTGRARDDGAAPDDTTGERSPCGRTVGVDP